MDALIAVVAGLFLLISVAPLERFLRAAAVESMMLAGLALEILGLLLAVLTYPLPNAAFSIAVVVLGWALVTYVVLHIRLALTPLQAIDSAEEHCVPKLTRGQKVKNPDPQPPLASTSGSFTWIEWIASCTPTDSSLREWLDSRAVHYRVLWSRVFRARIDRTWNIECEMKDGKCVIANPLAPHGTGSPMQDRLLTAAVGEDVEYDGSCVTMVVEMGLALDAAKVSVTAKASKAGVGGSVKIDFPDASIEQPLSMGVYKWCCQVPTTGAVPQTPGATGSSVGGSSTGQTGAGTGTGTTGGGSSAAEPPKRRTCANTYPDMIDCIDEGFDLETEDEMVEAAEAAGGEKITRIDKKLQDGRGPCPDKGYHYDFYGKSGEYHGSGFSCTCCEDDPDEGPLIKTKYKYNG